MIQLFILCFIIVGIALLLLGVNIFFLKKSFPNAHVGGNKGLQKKGIHCASTQDKEAQK